MLFSIFDRITSKVGQPCTYNAFLQATESKSTESTLLQIRKCDPKDHEKISKLKKQLPIVTWQAFFPRQRVNKEAIPSGMFMLDIDHVENPGEMYAKNIVSKIKQLHILAVHMTPSCHGLRIVAHCNPNFKTIIECQQWLAKELQVPFDTACKDFARASYLPSFSYFKYLNQNEIWGKPIVVYKNKETSTAAPAPAPASKQPAPAQNKPSSVKDYKGYPLESLAKSWLEHTGGEPVEGERNMRLYKLALRMRYFVDFNENTLFDVMPSYGLPVEEMRQLCHQATNAPRSADIPKDMQEVLEQHRMQSSLTNNEELDAYELDDAYSVRNTIPTLPPVFYEMALIAPKDFKQAVVLCQLPILGTLASRLRSKYLDGQMHSPSFQVSLEAPQASGKGFMRRLVDFELEQVISHDDEQRQRERDYEAKVREMKMLNIKVNKENKNEVLGERPETLIRFVPATISITKLLMRMNAAKGLHLFAFAEEIDTVTKAFKRGFSDFSDLLRVSFDNGLYGQDYATDTSFSGIIPIYYNFLCSGTPKAMKRFYPDVEDGLISRVLFVTLPDQFGKPMPVWQTLTDEQRLFIQHKLIDLNEISMDGDEVNNVHVMNLDYVNKELEKWILKQQSIALREDDRTRDIFCRRAAVVGFRAAMLAHFMYHEPTTSFMPLRNNVVAFALWVAESMLTQHLLRFQVNSNNSNTNRWTDVYDALPEEFDRVQLRRTLMQQGVKSSVRTVICKWRLGGFIEVTKTAPGERGQEAGVTFKKCKQ